MVGDMERRQERFDIPARIRVALRLWLPFQALGQETISRDAGLVIQIQTLRG